MTPIARAFRENERAIKRLMMQFLPSRPDVEDLAQETFLRAFIAEASADIAVPEAFLFSIARNLAINESRRAARARTSSIEDFPALDVLAIDQPSEDERLYDRQKMMAFAEAVSALPEQCRQVFVLRKVHGKSQKEVAAALGIAQSTVEKHVAAGLLRTSDYLRRRGFEVGGRAVDRTNVPVRRKGAADG